MTSIIDRLVALEATMAELKIENELLKMLTPLEAFTAGLKDASAEQVQAWAEACAEVAEAHGVGSSGEVKTKKGKKAKASEPKEKKKTTNAEGPSEWNIFVQATWHEMAAVKGIVGDHDEAFKKACKEAGITYQGALKEAGVRRAALEGREVGEKKVKAKKEKAAAPAPASAAAPRKPTAEEIKKATPEGNDAMRVAMTSEGEEMGWTAAFINDCACWLKEGGEVISYDCSETLGVYSDGEFLPMD